MRPATKQDLTAAADSQFGKLWALINSMDADMQSAPFAFEDRDKNLRDVLVHLHEWHMLFINWVHSNMAGNAANFLPAPYNWKTYPQMNVGFWEKHQGTPLDTAKALLKESHAGVMGSIGSFTDGQLFTKKYFPWTGTTSLGSYAVSAAPSHYDWAMKKIKQHIKSYKPLK